MMGLKRNVLSVICLMLIVWATFLLVSYIISVTIFYTLEYSQRNLFLSVVRVLIGVSIAGAWVVAWYKLTKIWLYKILLGGET